jgi:hypothetical protein
MKCKACNREMAAQDWNHRWVCTRCGRTKPYAEPMTNADHIRAMTDEELAELFVDRAGFTWSTAEYALVWLKQPYGGADHE